MSSTPSDPAISVVVCTRNRGGQLEGMLRSFCSQDFAVGWEMVVVDNGSSDNTGEVLTRFALECPFTLRVVLEPTPGLSRARNRGLAAARGEFVAFTDDDCYPRDDYLSAIVALFCDPKVVYGGGRLLLYDPTDQRVTIQERDRAEVLEPGSFIPSGLIHGANLVCRRQALLDLDGFDERLGAGTTYKSGEDTDILRRLALAGHRGRYDPDIVVYHHHGRKTVEAARRLEQGYSWGIGSCMLKYALNPQSRSIYARIWYWRLRRIPFADAVREIVAALRFFLEYGPTWRSVWRHPHEGLASPVEAREPA
ncbi:glycosyltransferase [Azoarcus olearius]|uniref:Glycosyltransferase n=1 Tax=Azoarcus sp. (strain BH72) TaxID=418699 RepID=A1KAL9_AZOSB|nr:glycosyltransferase [Azoarcus olearius]CAL95875.1 glycosyltransferase [Azoarcus olearius]